MSIGNILVVDDEPDICSLIKDILDESKTRTRNIYVGERENTLISRNELTDVSRGIQVELTFSGSF